MRPVAFAPMLALLAAACGGGTAAKPKDPLRINEVMANDEGGTAIDEVGQIGDWIELVNTGAIAVDLSVYTLSDGTHPDAPLPPRLLGAGATILLWADGKPNRGDTHLDFKIDADGESLVLKNGAGAVA